jgi:hypothetical protein
MGWEQQRFETNDEFPSILAVPDAVPCCSRLLFPVPLSLERELREQRPVWGTNTVRI